MRTNTWAAIALMLSFTGAAGAQVVFTELQPNLIGIDDGEWFELQNLGTSSVAIGGWTISDFSGGMEVATRWAFPATASVAPGQVLVVTKQFARFAEVFPAVRAQYEFAEGADDMGVPNLVRGGGMATFAMGNMGDGLLLRDGMGAIVDGVEYGTTDIAAVPGLPYPNIPNPMTPVNNPSITRVMRTGSSAADYSDRFNASPGVGFTTLVGPRITNARSRPRHVAFGEMYTITASISSAEPLSTIEVYYTTATSSTGPASGEYLAVELTPVASSSATYSYSANIETFVAGRGFGMPATFHDVYARWFVRASDVVGNVTSEPTAAEETAGNAAYLPTYLQNVLPATPTTIAAAREEASGRPGPRWRGHSVRVVGTVLSGPNLAQPGKLQFAIQDASNKAITVFDNNADVSTFMFAPGDVLRVTGTLTDFRGLTEIGSNIRIENTMMTAPIPAPTVQTIAQINAGGDALESQLVKIDGVSFVGATPAMWPGDPANLPSWNVRVTDGTGELTVRVTSSATGVFGAAAPQFGFDITGVLGERDGMWQVFPRTAADVVARPMPDPADAGVTPQPDAAADGNPDAATGRDASTSRVDSGGAVINPPADDGGCGCATGERSSAMETMLALVAVLGVALRRRRA